MKLCGPGDVARECRPGEGIPFELSRSTYPGRHVARETYPQRQVARDTPDLSLGNIINVVVPVRINWYQSCFNSRVPKEKEKKENKELLIHDDEATIEIRKFEADWQFAEIMNALKALQPPTTLPEDTTKMIDTEKSGEDRGNLEEFTVESDIEEAAITTPIIVVAEELGQKLIYDFGEADYPTLGPVLRCDNVL
ncbi:hypothetical protein Tco_0095122, partial [Tanacetum coccineum]